MLSITREEKETWLECALRYAKPYGLEKEVGEAYDKHRGQGRDPSECAMSACEEWDIVDFEPSAEM